MTTATISRRFVLRVPAESLQSCHLVFDPKALAGGSIDTKDLSRQYEKDPRRLPEEWLALLEKRQSLGAGPVVMQTWRNLVQNRGCPAFDRQFGVVQSARENFEKHQRAYRGISFLRDGRMRADAFSSSESLPDDVMSFGTGIPVVWGGEILTVNEIAPDVSDFSHLFDLNLFNASGSIPDDERERYERFQRIYERVRHSDSETASEAILEEARAYSERVGDANLEGSIHKYWPTLNRNTSYLHNVIGLDRNGGVVIVIANGRLEEMGELARNAGCEAAFVIDNGGSTSCLLRRAPEMPLRSLAESHYWRPPSVAVAVYSLKEGTPLLVAAPRQEHAFRQRSLRVQVHYSTDLGIVTRTIIYARLDLEAARAMAVSIANFAVVHGASSVWIEAPAVWVKHVRACFAERFRATQRREDPTTLRGLRLEDYLQGIYDVPFEIHAGDPPIDAGRCTPVIGATRDAIARYALGIDVGASKIKTVLLKQGAIVATFEEETRPPNPNDYDSDFLSGQLQAGTDRACKSAGITVAEIDAIGVSWAGAVRNGKAAPSKSLLDLRDVLSDGRLDRDVLDRVRDLQHWIPNVLGARENLIAQVWNDGEVEVAALREPSTLLIKLGSTVAGGYADRLGRTAYLTEFGRVVIRLDSGAPRHRDSRIQGVASMLVGGFALARMCDERALKTAEGEPLTKHRADAGRKVSQMMDSPQGRDIEEVVIEMGRHVAELIVEVVDHLDDVKRIRLCGGPMKGAVGEALRRTVLSELPEHLRKALGQEESHTDSGAVAAAHLASRSQCDARQGDPEA